MSPPSLRSRLLLLLVGSAVAVTCVGGVIVDRLVHQRIAAGFDQELVGKARAIATLAKQSSDGVELDFADEFMPEFENEEDPQYFQLQLAGGSLIELSRSFVHAPEGARLASLAAASAQPRFRDVTLPDGRAGRQVQLDFIPQLTDDLEAAGVSGAPTGWIRERQDGSLDLPAAMPEGRVVASILIGRERGSLDRRLLLVRIAMLATGAGLVGAVAGLSAFVLSVGLRPVRRLARDVSALDARSLGARLDVEALPLELRPIAGQVNGLLERIGATVERERQLTSDIAHDLKTPVAELRALCDVGGRWPEDREATARFFHDARDVAITLERTIERLLALARHDAGHETIAPSRFDLADVLRGAGSAFAPSAAARGLDLRLSVDGSVELESDRDKVARILTNLLENAVAHATPGTVVTLDLRSEAAGGVALRISNASADLVPEDLPHIFERFWRKDTARGDGRHAGLGLALARAHAELLGMRLTAELDAQRVFSVVLRLNGANGAAASAAAS